MPAIITHHIFGEDIAAELPAGVLEGEEELLAFLLGNQGPDPLAARITALPARARACHELGRRMQGGRVTRALLALREGVSHLPALDERIGRAFALGMLGHYALDRAAHPFVISQQRALAAADPALARRQREVHAIIETDIDTWILWEKRGATVEERPAATNLMRTERVERVAGALLSQVALSVFGIALGAREYGACLRDYELVCRLGEPLSSGRARLVGAVERVVLGSSLVLALGHRVLRSHDCPAANLDCRPWEHPYGGGWCTESFADLFDEARLAYPELAEALARGDEERLRALVAGLSYAGEPGCDD